MNTHSHAHTHTIFWWQGPSENGRLRCSKHQKSTSYTAAWQIWNKSSLLSTLHVFCVIIICSLLLRKHVVSTQIAHFRDKKNTTHSLFDPTAPTTPASEAKPTAIIHASGVCGCIHASGWMFVRACVAACACVYVGTCERVCVCERGNKRREREKGKRERKEYRAISIRDHAISRPIPNVQPIPLGVTFSKALSKLKAQSSNVSFHWNVAKETFELWSLSFDTAFENVTQVGSGVLCISIFLSIHVF